jgi:purine-nucleoside/S-methyl-5'-thioadenosine phosphorylase / adenosine deaminase
VTRQYPVEHFPALDAPGICQSAFIDRIPGIVVSQDKQQALRRLDSIHGEIRRWLGFNRWPLVTAEQIHGDKVAVIDQPVRSDEEFPGCDGLLTDQPGVALGIRVADCCAVFMVDPLTPAIALVHAGKKGTELGIVGKTIERMAERFCTKPEELIVQLSPCIRPPHYEIDFAAEIIRQCESHGVVRIHDGGVCTACHLEKYYSYRAEKGKTGRMLALLALK